MKLSELIDLLTEAQMDCGEDLDPEVLMAIQPSYPLAFTVRSVGLEPENDDPTDAKAPERAVWITQGSHPDHLGRSPYAPGRVWEL